MIAAGSGEHQGGLSAVIALVDLGAAVEQVGADGVVSEVRRIHQCRPATLVRLVHIAALTANKPLNPKRFNAMLARCQNCPSSNFVEKL